MVSLLRNQYIVLGYNTCVDHSLAILQTILFHVPFNWKYAIIANRTTTVTSLYMAHVQLYTHTCAREVISSHRVGSGGHVFNIRGIYIRDLLRGARLYIIESDCIAYLRMLILKWFPYKVGPY